MPIIVGISGKRGAGKDLLGNYLSYQGFKAQSFAGELKERCRRDFGLTKEQTDGAQKESPTKLLHESYGLPGLPPGANWTPREIMIAYGQFFRQFDNLFWVKKTFEKVGLLAPNTLVCVTDVRFKNEADYIKENKGYLVRLERRPELNIYKGNLDDISETQLDDYDRFDMKLPKELNETPQDLEKFAYKIMEFVKQNPRG